MAQFYADSAGSQGTGDGSSAANACTLDQFLTDNAVLHTARADGDHCWVKGGTSITTESTYSLDMLSICEGYTTSTGDGGVVVLDGGNSRATCLTVDGTSGNPAVHLINFRLTNAQADCLRATNSSNDSHRFYNCEFDLASSNGCEVSYNGAATPIRNPQFYNCYFHDNSDGYNGRGAEFYNCVFRENTGNHIQSLISLEAFGCIFDDSDDHAITCGMSSDSQFMRILNCTFNDTAAGKDAIQQTDATDPAGYMHIENCGFANIGGYAINSTGTFTLPDQQLIIRSNATYNMQSGYLNGVSGQYVDSTPVATTDPLFADAANGDFSLGPSSPWRAAADVGAFKDGTNRTYLDIGALQRSGGVARIITS
jgi:hypothetical protein